MPSRIYSPEDPEVVNSNTILKHILKKKYDWVIDVNLVFITVRESRTDRDYNEIVLDGVIKVDKDWYENQWREYNYYNLPIPDPNDDRDVVLGELLGSELAMKFNSECRKAITLSLKRQIQGLIWSSLVVRTEEVKKEDMTESIRRILREETRPLKIMRRTHLIDNEIAKLLKRVYYDKRICRRYDDANMFMNVVQEAVLENLYFSTLHNMMDDTSEEWESSANFIYDFIKDSYGEKLKDYFNNMCNERVDIDESKSPKSKKVKCSKCGWSWKLSEGGHDPYTCHKCGNINSKSELTEKCWAGYTQKGMKTMFGKRYPNCVKKTKK